MDFKPLVYVLQAPAELACAGDAHPWWNGCGLARQVLAKRLRASAQHPGQLLKSQQFRVVHSLLRVGAVEQGDDRLRPSVPATGTIRLLLARLG